MFSVTVNAVDHRFAVQAEAIAFATKHNAEWFYVATGVQL